MKLPQNTYRQKVLKTIGADVVDGTMLTGTAAAHDGPSKNCDYTHSNRRRFLKGALGLGAVPYAVSSISQNASAATNEELFDRLERQLAHFDDLLATTDDTVLVDYRREQLDTLANKIESADIPKGQKTQLQSKVSAALDSNDRAGEYAVTGNEADSEEEQDATDGQLTAFINSVESQQGEKIDESIGDMFIDIATQALDARENPLVRADDIQNRDAPTSSAFVSHVEDSFDELRGIVSALEDEGYNVTVDYFHEDGPVIDVNPLFSIPLGALGLATLGALKASVGIIGLKTLGAVGFVTMGGWVATHHPSAFQLVQQFYKYTPNFRLAAGRYLLRENYEQGLEDMQDRIEGNDSALENGIEKLASIAIGRLIPPLSTDEAAVLVEYFSELLKQLIDVILGTTAPGAVYSRDSGGWIQIGDNLTGDDGSVTDIVEYNGNTFVGVTTLTSQYEGIGQVYKQNDGSWSLVGDNLENNVSTLAVYGGDLYAGTSYGDANLYRYDGPNSWTRVINNTSWEGISSSYVWADKLFVGDALFDKYAYYDGTSLTVEQPESVGSCVYDFVPHGETLYGGNWNGVLRERDGGSWSVVADVGSGGLLELVTHDGNMYVGQAGGTLYRWDPTNNSLTSVYEFSDSIVSLLSMNDGLYVGIGQNAAEYDDSSRRSAPGEVYQYLDGTATRISDSDQFGDAAQELVKLS